VEFDIPTGSKLANMAQYAIFLALIHLKTHLNACRKILGQSLTAAIMARL
jgi:hypothetical protein